MSICAIGILVIGMSGCASEPHRDLTKAHPAERSTVIALPDDGRWIDLEGAVDLAATDAGMAVVGIDRWELGIMFQLQTQRDQSGSLLVVGRRLDIWDEGVGILKPTHAEARIGRLGDPQGEERMLQMLYWHLNQLKSTSVE